MCFQNKNIVLNFSTYTRVYTVSPCLYSIITPNRNVTNDDFHILYLIKIVPQLILIGILIEILIGFLIIIGIIIGSLVIQIMNIHGTTVFYGISKFWFEWPRETKTFIYFLLIFSFDYIRSKCILMSLNQTITFKFFILFKYLQWVKSYLEPRSIFWEAEMSDAGYDVFIFDIVAQRIDSSCNLFNKLFFISY